MLRSAAAPSRCFTQCVFARPVSRISPIGVRSINITSSAPSDDPDVQPVVSSSGSSAAPSPDARFEVVGSPFSLLSVSLAASQQFYTRRGTLVGLSGKVENTLSTLAFLEPFRRALVGIPFMYQRISSTSPVTALISTKSSVSSIVTVHLDGRQDWVISQRQALLAWTGHTLSLKPKLNPKLSLAHWGNTHVTGRGLLALVGTGQIYQVQLKPGETYVAHPSNVVAFTASSNPPLPFRFKSSNIRFQIPDLGFGSIVQNVKFLRVMSETPTWRTLGRWLHTLKTWARRSIWGDRLFLQFQGPGTMLLQSRGSRVSDVLTLRDVDEIAETPPGVVEDVVSQTIRKEIEEVKSPAPATDTPSYTKVRYANVGPDGKVNIGESKKE